MRSVARRGILGLFGVGLLASCSLAVGLDDIQIGATDPCKVDGDCADDNPCTSDSCKADGSCSHEAVEKAVQVTGDCQRIECADGVPKTVADEEDTPPGKGICRVGACAKGEPTEEPAKDGTACVTTQGMTGACTSGDCLTECSPSKECPDAGPCASATCNFATGKCVVANTHEGQATPGFMQIDGDCKKHVCQGGVDTEVVDQSDVPHTATECDLEECAADGTPSNPPVDENQPCGANGKQVCDGAGKCVECTATMVAQCPGADGSTAPDDDCFKRACGSDGTCQPILAESGTATVSAPNLQTPGDCHQIRCDGAGHAKKMVDDTDLPDDGNDCTNDLCNNGVPSHTNEPMGAICDTSLACNASGQCTGCTLNAQCTAPNTCGGGGTPTVCGCTPTTCNAQGKTCGTINDGCFNPVLNCNNGAKNGTETDVDCGGDPNSCATRCSNGKTCNVGSDCASGNCVDGVCCDTACNGTCVACTAAKKGTGQNGTCGAIKLGADPDNECTATHTYCNGAGACLVCGTNDAAGDSKCPKNYYCTGAACVADLTTGSACARGTQCLSSACFNNVCL